MKGHQWLHVLSQLVIMCFFSASKMVTPAKRGTQGIFLFQIQVYYSHTLQSERFPWRITAERLLFGSIVTSLVGPNRAILLQHFKVLVVDWCFNLTRSLYVLWFCIVKKMKTVAYKRACAVGELWGCVGRANPHISHVGLTVGCSHTGLAAVLPFGGPLLAV